MYCPIGDIQSKGKCRNAWHFTDVVEGLSLKHDAETIVKRAKEFGSSDVMFVHGHLKDTIIDAADVCFDYRLLSSGDVTDLVTRQTEIGDKLRLYTACIRLRRGSDCRECKPDRRYAFQQACSVCQQAGKTGRQGRQASEQG